MMLSDFYMTDLVKIISPYLDIMNMYNMERKSIKSLREKIDPLIEPHVIKTILESFPTLLLNRVNVPIKDIRVFIKKIPRISGKKIEMALYILHHMMLFYNNEKKDKDKDKDKDEKKDVEKKIEKEITFIDMGCGKAHITMALIYLMKTLKLSFSVKKIILTDILDNEKYVNDQLTRLKLNGLITVEYQKRDFMKTSLNDIIKDVTGPIFIMAFHFDGGLWMKLVDEIVSLKEKSISNKSPPISGIIFPCCYNKHQPAYYQWKSPLYRRISTIPITSSFMKSIQKNVFTHSKEDDKNYYKYKVMIFTHCLYSTLGYRIRNFGIRQDKNIIDIIKNRDDFPMNLSLIKMMGVLKIIHPLLKSSDLKVSIPIINMDILLQSYRSSIQLYEYIITTISDIGNLVGLVEISFILDNINLLYHNNIIKGRIKGSYDRNYFFAFHDIPLTP